MQRDQWKSMAPRGTEVWKRTRTGKKEEETALWLSKSEPRNGAPCLRCAARLLATPPGTGNDSSHDCLEISSHCRASRIGSGSGQRARVRPLSNPPADHLFIFSAHVVLLGWPHAQAQAAQLSPGGEKRKMQRTGCAVFKLVIIIITWYGWGALVRSPSMR